MATWVSANCIWFNSGQNCVRAGDYCIADYPDEFVHRLSHNISLNATIFITKLGENLWSLNFQLPRETVFGEHHLFSTPNPFSTRENWWRKNRGWTLMDADKNRTWIRVYLRPSAVLKRKPASKDTGKTSRSKNFAFTEKSLNGRQ